MFKGWVIYLYNEPAFLSHHIQLRVLKHILKWNPHIDMLIRVSISRCHHPTPVTQPTLLLYHTHPLNVYTTWMAQLLFGEFAIDPASVSPFLHLLFVLSHVYGIQKYFFKHRSMKSIKCRVLIHCSLVVSLRSIYVFQFPHPMGWAFISRTKNPK